MICPYCNKQAPWVENKVKYGKNYGNSYMCYFCKPCDSYVGCHQNTRRPLGTMANAELRKWRMEAHKVIDSRWKSGEMGRKEMYKMLDQMMGKVMHIGESTVEECKEIISKFS